jgi:hypothetical protein
LVELLNREAHRVLHGLRIIGIEPRAARSLHPITSME